jgi:hypothetical protein
MVSVFNRQPSNELPMANVDLPVLAGDSSVAPRLSLKQSNEDQEFKTEICYAWQRGSSRFDELQHC